eukprot:PhM_4_TR5394/c0_g4_i1/m.84156
MTSPCDFSCLNSCDVDATSERRMTHIVIPYVRWLEKARYVLLFLFIIAMIGLAYPSFELSGVVEQLMTPPDDAPSSKAKRAFEKSFPGVDSSTAIVLFANANDGNPIFRPSYAAFESDLMIACKARAEVTSFNSYSSNVAMKLPVAVARRYVSEDNTSSISTVALNMSGSDERTVHFSSFFKDKVRELEEKHFGEANRQTRWSLDGQNIIDFYILSANEFSDAASAAATDDLFHMVAVVIPICAVVFCWHVAAIRFILAPVVIMLFTLNTTYATLYLASSHIKVASLTPGITMFLGLAVSSNYSIFLIDTYRRDVRYRLRHRAVSSLKDDMTRHAVESLLLIAGHKVTVSGIMLALLCSGLCVFPMDVMRSIGFGCLLVAVYATIAATTVVPVLLLSFPRFFSHGVQETCFEGMQVMDLCRVRGDVPDEDFEGLISPKDGPDGPSLFSTAFAFAHTWGDTSPRSNVPSRTKALKKSKYFKLAVFVTTTPFNIIVIVLLCLACGYPMWRSFELKYTNSVPLMLPRGGPDVTGWTDLMRKFSPGEVIPYRLALDLRSNVNATILTDPDAWTEAQSLLLRAVEEVPHTRCENFASVVLDGANNCTKTVQSDITLQSFICSLNITACSGEALYDTILISLFTNLETYRSIWVMVKLSMDPTGHHGVMWYRDMLDFLDKYNDNPNHKFHASLSGYAAETIDVIAFVSQHFSFMMLITVCVVLGVMCVVYRSVITPWRAVLNVAFTMLTIWGLVNLVYLDGFLKLMNMGATNPTGAIAWIAPYSAFMICVRQSFDLDLLYFQVVSRLHLRDNKPVRAALREGLALAGSTTTAAGSIMSISFSGLLLSRLPVMNQLGLYLVLTGLFDTFVTRLLLVPAMMSLLGEWSWAPRSCVYRPAEGVVTPQDAPLPDNLQNSPPNSYSVASSSSRYNHQHDVSFDVPTE